MDDRIPELGLVYPPRSAAEILAYDRAEMTMAFLDFDQDELEPGSNRSPAYRWSWRTRLRDCEGVDDGFDMLRRSAFRLRKACMTDVRSASDIASQHAAYLAWQHGTDL